MTPSSHHQDDHNMGFAHDLPRLIGRRHLLSLLGGLGLAGAGARPAAAQACVALPWETAGPFPADGSNSRQGRPLNVLTQSGIIREDIRPSFGDYSRTPNGLALELDITLMNADGCTPLSGAAIYIWHCDEVGRYSLYDVADANYLRGVGIADAQGKVRFTTDFPGCYRGRWPHIHFEIFETIEAASSGEASLLTSQIALPRDACAQVYAADSRYTNGTRNLGGITLERDGIFRDNTEKQLIQQTLRLTGNTESGYNGTVTIPVDIFARR